MNSYDLRNTLRTEPHKLIEEIWIARDSAHGVLIEGVNIVSFIYDTEDRGVFFIVYRPFGDEKELKETYFRVPYRIRWKNDKQGQST